MSHRRSASRILPFLALALSAAAACSAGTGNTFPDGGTGATSSGAGGSGTGNMGQGGDPILTTSGTNTGTGQGGATSCAAEPHQAQQLPLDMYLMLDQSGSMEDPTGTGQSKWQAVTSALQSFLGQPGLAGISVGIQYFPLFACPLICKTAADCGNWGPCDPGSLWGVSFNVCSACGQQFDPTSCNAADYAKPEVEIGPIGTTAAKIQASIAKHFPTTNTPTSAALAGALTHGKTWLANHANHVVIAVLATDGMPTDCDPMDQGGISQIAAQGLADGVKTFTIGIFGQSDMPAGPNLLNAVSQAGGTGSTFTINSSGNVNQQFLDALNKIRGAALGCQYDIPVPQTGTPDYNRVNVQYTPQGTGTPVVFPYVGGKTACAGAPDGWYYDDANAPKQIILCDQTCNKVSADATGKIDILLGCATEVPQ